MAQDGLSALTRQLHGSPPPAVAGLTDEQLSHLSDALRAVRRRQAAELESASAQALDRLPRLLRGPVKKIVG